MFKGFFFMMTRKKSIKIADSLEELFNIPAKDLKLNDNNPEEFIGGSRDSDIRLKQESLGNFSQRMVCPPPLDKIRITRRAFTDLILLSKAVNEYAKQKWGKETPKLEIYCYVLTDSKDYHKEEQAIIKGIYIPHHKASETSVEVNPEDILEVKRYIEISKKVILGWAHSHGHFEVYSSKIDEENHQRLLMDTGNIIEIDSYPQKYAYGITINDQEDRFGVILTQYPCGIIQRKVDEQFEISGKPYSLSEKKKRYKEMLEAVQDRVNLIEPIPDKSFAELKMSLSEEFLTEFIHNLRRAKILLYDKLPKNMENKFPELQKTIQSYDDLLLDTVEETFHKVSDRLMNVLNDQKDSI
jgi:proteasome lid subunit RPN8/RPN11